MSLTTLSVDDAGVARLHLDDPDHRNVLSFEMSQSIAAGVGQALEQGARALVLTAAAPVFCAGGSLEGLLERARPLAETYSGYLALGDCPVPTIAVVDGPAIGAGINLPLACDVVLAGPGARFDPRFLDVGIHPGGGHYLRLVDRVGPQGAAALSLFGDALTGEEAAQVGLAWRCLPSDELLPFALRLAARAAGRDPGLVARAKQTLRATRGVTSLPEAFALELDAQEWSVGRPEFTEAVQRMRASIAAKAAQ